MSANHIFYEQVKAQGETRRKVGPADTAETFFQNLQVNNRGDLLNAQSLPERTEIARLGGSWATEMLTSVAAVTAIPTTAAQHLMRNGNAAGGKSFVIDRIFYRITTAFTDVDTGFAVMASVIPVQAAVSSAQAVLVNSLSGFGSYNGLATFDDANTLAADKGWFALNMQTTNGGAPHTNNTIFYCNVDGGIIVPPGGGLALALMGVDTVGQGRPGFVWHEVVLPVNGA